MWQLGVRGWLDIGRACYELGRARMELGGLDPATFPAPVHIAAQAQIPLPSEDALAQIARIGPAILRAARIVPWRSDCLVQAEAARHWLARRGIGATIHLGARKTTDGGTEMHAWLVSHDRIVTGGQITSYTPFK